MISEKGSLTRCSSTFFTTIRECPMDKSRFSRVVGPSIHSPYFLWHSAENNISRWTHSHLLSWKTRLLTAFHLVTICITIAEKANLASPCHAAWVERKWCHCSQQVDQNFKTFETYQPPRSHCQNRSRAALCIWMSAVVSDVPGDVWKEMCRACVALKRCHKYI